MRWISTLQILRRKEEEVVKAARKRGESFAGFAKCVSWKKGIQTDEGAVIYRQKTGQLHRGEKGRTFSHTSSRFPRKKGSYKRT